MRKAGMAAARMISARKILGMRKRCRFRRGFAAPEAFFLCAESAILKRLDS